MIDITENFAILGHETLSKPIFSLCVMNKTTIICGCQAGHLAMIQVQDRELIKIAENKIVSAIYKVIRTS